MSGRSRCDALSSFGVLSLQSSKPQCVQRINMCFKVANFIQFPDQRPEDRGASKQASIKSPEKHSFLFIQKGAIFEPDRLMRPQPLT